MLATGCGLGVLRVFHVWEGARGGAYTLCEDILLSARDGMGSDRAPSRF